VIEFDGKPVESIKEVFDSSSSSSNLHCNADAKISYG
jgi:hypothetical protein